MIQNIVINNEKTRREKSHKKLSTKNIFIYEFSLSLKGLRDFPLKSRDFINTNMV
jgi:hypothetical protein